MSAAVLAILTTVEPPATRVSALLPYTPPAVLVALLWDPILRPCDAFVVMHEITQNRSLLNAPSFQWGHSDYNLCGMIQTKLPTYNICSRHTSTCVKFLAPTIVTHIDPRPPENHVLLLSTSSPLHFGLPVGIWRCFLGWSPPRATAHEITHTSHPLLEFLPAMLPVCCVPCKRAAQLQRGGFPPPSLRTPSALSPVHVRTTLPGESREMAADG